MGKPQASEVIAPGVRVDHVTVGDCLEVLSRIPDETIQCCITSPPYWKLRDYKAANQIGLEDSLEQYIDRLVAVFAQVRRVLKRDGTLFLNMGDAYIANAQGARMQPPGESTEQIRVKGAALLKTKDLVGLPWRLAFALQTGGVPMGAERLLAEVIAQGESCGDLPEGAMLIMTEILNRVADYAKRKARGDGWFLRNDVIWWKINGRPESCRDRCPRVHEYLFHFAKSRRYYYDGDATREPYAKDSLLRMLRAHSKDGKLLHADDPRVSNWQSRPRLRRSKMTAAKGAPLEGMHIDRATTGHEVDLNPKGRLKPTIWPVACAGTSDEHYAVFPEELVRPCILAATREGDVVLDPFAGTATTGVVAMRYRRRFVGIEISPRYARLGEKRLEPFRAQLQINLKS